MKNFGYPIYIVSHENVTQLCNGKYEMCNKYKNQILDKNSKYQKYTQHTIFPEYK